MSDKRGLSAVLDEGEVVAGFSRLSISVIVTNPRAPDNPIVYVNDAFERTTGYSRSSVIGRNCRFLQGERTEKATVDQLRHAIDGGRDVSVEILNYRASGEPFLNRLTIAPISDRDGKPLYFMGLQQELRTNENRRSDQDTRLDKIRSRVRSDLGMVLSSIGMPEHGLSMDDPMQEVEALPRRLECLELVYEELSLADDHAEWNGIDLGALLGRVASTVAHRESRPGIRFSLRVDPTEVALEAAIRIAMIVSETVSNAFTHAFVGLDRGSVDLRVQRLSEGGLRIMVCDDGVGISPRLDWPSDDTRGGRLIASLLDGLDATINIARGAAGTVVMIDVPFDPQDLTEQGG